MEADQPVSIEPLIQATGILESPSWKPITLDMTEAGIASFRTEVEAMPRVPVVYVHVEDETNRVLRVGQAKLGLLERWCKSASGHLATIEWATGASTKYRSSAGRHPHYVLFFKRLENRKTTVWFVECEHAALDGVESMLIGYFQPVWERFLGQYKSSSEAIKSKVQTAATTVPYTAQGLLDIADLDSGRCWPMVPV